MLIFVLLMALKSAFGEPLQIGLGAAFGPRHGVSVLVQDDPRSSYHMTVRYTEDFMLLSTDVQRHARFGWFGRHYVSSVYAGLGFEGQSEKNRGETFYGRLPIGLQVADQRLSVQGFAELVPRAGPLPITSFAPEVRGGIRALF
jgi:hypothetical protein